jgi:hypothetical protein
LIEGGVTSLIRKKAKDIPALLVRALSLAPQPLRLATSRAACPSQRWRQFSPPKNAFPFWARQDPTLPHKVMVALGVSGRGSCSGYIAFYATVYYLYVNNAFLLPNLKPLQIGTRRLGSVRRARVRAACRIFRSRARPVSGEVEWALQRASLCVKFVVHRTKANAAKGNKESQVVQILVSVYVCQKVNEQQT